MTKYLTLFLLILLSNISFAQHRIFSDSNPSNITDVSFDKDHIILNKKIAYTYQRIENDFTLRNLENEIILEGYIENIAYKTFKTTITFSEPKVDFYNARIVGRNDLIFALVNFNVFNTDGTIDPKRLALFIQNFNELKN